MGKPIEVVSAPDKKVFNYHCKVCNEWRPVTRYEAYQEAAEVIAAKLRGESHPKRDEERIFFGPYCSVECLETENLKIWEEPIEKEKEDNSRKSNGARGKGEKGSGGKGVTE